MSRTPWALSEAWRDYAGMWNPAVEPWIAPLGSSKCHAPRVMQLPPLDQALIPAGEKLEYNFRIAPGSVIYGVIMTTFQLTLQLTDVGVGHSLFQEPCDGSILTDTGSEQAMAQGFFLFPCPWPVTGDGLFTLEVWNDLGGDRRYFLQLLVAEVTQCPVRG